jgi:hypothetical protein
MKSLLTKGNWWGHTPPDPLFTEGEDSNMAGVVDSYPYPRKDGWLLIVCTVLTDNNGYATSWFFHLGPVSEVNLIRAAVSGTDLSVVFQATATEHLLSQPAVDIYCPTITNDPTPPLFGLADPDCVISIYDSAGSLLVTTTVNSLGQWSVELPTLLDGVYSLMIQASNDGYVSEYVFITLTIDTLGPEIIISRPVTDQMITVTDELVFDIYYSNGLAGIDRGSLSISLNNMPQGDTSHCHKGTHPIGYKPLFSS